ncbi:acyl carrier protein [Streptomyces hirsutus]|uniref:acyl carrier protein n=1 Tax=Streptomyces hirsutus TaxID=35620 RepID=UPI00200F7F05|nr:phosphopantetheine-binding protein [Streptomyces hirsutus]
MPQPFEHSGFLRPHLNVAQDQDLNPMGVLTTYRRVFVASLLDPGDPGHRTGTHRTTNGISGTHSVNPSRAKKRHPEFHLSNTNLLCIPGIEAVATDSSGIDDSSCRATVIDSRGPAGGQQRPERDGSVSTQGACMLEKSAESLTAVPDESGATEHSTHSPSKENSSSADAERDLAEILAGVLCVERVPVDSNFFDDLGANSLVMAQLCARVRKRADLPSVSIKDIYRYRTIRSLAAALTDVGTGIAATPAPVSQPDPASSEAVNPIDTLQYILCGTLQFLLFVGYSFIAAILATRGYSWISVGSNVADIYLRSVIFGGVGSVAICTFPIVAKWILIDRWKERSFPVWGLP